MYVNWKRRELVITIALYGPQGSGKTTTWRHLVRGAPDIPDAGSDTLSLRLDEVQGKRVILHIRDIPGGEEEAGRRRVALYGVDGVIFVADSDASRLEDNRRSLGELTAYLDDMQKSIYDLSFLFQYNKRDLQHALSIDDLQDDLNVERVFPYQETIALRGEGLVEVLKQATDLVLAMAVV